MRAEAIHNKEARSALQGLRRASRRGNAHNKQVLSLGDNMSELLATEFGRARNHELNALCRRSAVLQMSSNIIWKRRHVISEENAADGDSRLADLGIIKPGVCLGGSILLKRLVRHDKLETRHLGPPSPLPFPSRLLQYDLHPCCR
jgi:hypothetical protein